MFENNDRIEIWVGSHPGRTPWRMRVLQWLGLRPWVTLITPPRYYVTSHASGTFRVFSGTAPEGCLL